MVATLLLRLVVPYLLYPVLFSLCYAIVSSSPSLYVYFLLSPMLSVHCTPRFLFRDRPYRGQDAPPSMTIRTQISPVSGAGNDCDVSGGCREPLSVRVAAENLAQLLPRHSRSRARSRACVKWIWWARRCEPVVGGVQAPRAEAVGRVLVRLVGQRVELQPAGHRHGVEPVVVLVDPQFRLANHGQAQRGLVVGGLLDL